MVDTKKALWGVVAVLLGVVVSLLAPHPAMAADAEWGYGNPEHTVRWDMTEEDGQKVLTFTVLDGASTDKEKAITRLLDQNGNAVTSTFRDSINVVRTEEGITGIGWTALYDRNTNYQPQYPSDYPVNKSETGVFQDCHNLTTVQPCSTIKRIGWSAFRRCTSLTNFDFSKLTNLEEIMNQAFSPCGLTEVDLSACTSLRAINHAAFSGSGSNAAPHPLTSVRLPASLETIGSSVFMACQRLESVTFEDISSVTSLGQSAFRGNSRSNPNPLTQITDEATKQRACTRNAARKLFSGVSSLPSNAFDYTSLEVQDWELSIKVKDRLTTYDGGEQKGYEVGSVTGTGSAVEEEGFSVTGLRQGHVMDGIGYEPPVGEDAGTYDDGRFPENLTCQAMYGGYDYGINYVVSGTPGNLVIGKYPALEIRVTGHVGMAVYDGTEHSASGYDLEPVDPDIDWYTAEDVSLDGAAVASRTDAGTTYMGLDPKQFANANENVEKVTFTIASDGYVEVQRASLAISTGSAKKEYDGTPLTCDEVSVKGLADVDDITVTTTGTRTSVGSSPNTYEIAWGSTSPDNYDVNEELGELVITPATVKPTDGDTKPGPRGDAKASRAVTPATGDTNDATRCVVAAVIAFSSLCVANRLRDRGELAR